MIGAKSFGSIVDCALAVTLTSCGNPDFGQDPNKPLSPKIALPCFTLAEASKICRDYITQHNLGGGNWSGGAVYHPTEGLVAHVSYNGRVWAVKNEKDIGSVDKLPEYTGRDLNVNFNLIDFESITKN